MIEKTRDNRNTFLCQFISFDPKSQKVKGKVIEAMVNPRMYAHAIEQGWILENALKECSLYGKDKENAWGHYHNFNSLGFALDPLEEYKVIENEMHVSKHPSFGLISASRRSSSSNVKLFGSSIQHSQTITITISRARHDRTNGADYIHSENEIIEVEMSQVQFAEFITTMNQGSGIPCTLKHINRERIEEPPYISKADIFQDEFAAGMHNLSIKMQGLVKNTLEILKTKTNLTKGDKEIIIEDIEKLGQELSSNIPHMNNQFTKQMDKTIVEAKGEIEAFLENKIRSTGIAALNNPDVIQQLKEANGINNIQNQID